MPGGGPPPAGESGFRLLPDGIGAFVARAWLARTATRSLDLQYYLINADDTGRLLAGEVLAAADRGVRVRILLDDLYTLQTDRAIATLDSHPGIEVRLFNPWTRRRGLLARALGFLLDPVRLNRRMHNKLFAADARAVIVGGRNIGDEYFDLDPRMNFRDLDVLAVGPVAADAVASFEEYWNSEWATPAAALGGRPPAAADLGALRARLAAHRESVRDSAYAGALEDSLIAAQFASHSLALEFGTARVIADSPAKIGAAGTGREDYLVERLREQAREARRELLVSSPYFVPRQRGVDALTSLVRDGVEVSVLTNSLAANDVGIVHGGYARHRVPLLRGGVRLYELRPAAAPVASRRDRRRFGSDNVSLHAKYLVMDRRSLFVGSLNLDPRSIEYNTEIGLLIDCEPLARQAAALFSHASSGAFSYAVSLRDGPRGRSGALVWRCEEAGRELRYDREPDTAWWRRAAARVAGTLTFMESQI
jgi:putative cardiolipin synthase